ncbi:hypothetical protein BC833DRAFT_323781 [Globomyces pollinis-pini]|nr:hypothetical protein BC833DRAFT_323781 [Globomyces pollinis-pini]
MRIKSEFQYPDGIITERYNEIQSVYEEYMYTYEKFREGVDEYVSLNFKFEIEITNLFKNVTRPFQRLLDYRYFLRTCLICIRKSKVSFTHHLQMLEYLNLTVIEKLTLFINQFHKADKFLELAKWEDNVLTQDCKISGFGNISPDTVSIVFLVVVSLVRDWICI